MAFIYALKQSDNYLHLKRSRYTFQRNYYSKMEFSKNSKKNSNYCDLNKR